MIGLLDYQNQNPMASAGLLQGGLLANQVHSQMQPQKVFTQQSQASPILSMLMAQGAQIPWNGSYGTFRYGSAPPGAALTNWAPGQLGSSSPGTPKASNTEMESDMRQYLAMGGRDPLGLYPGYYSPERQAELNKQYLANQP